MLCFLLCGTGAMPSTKIPLPMLNNAYISKKDCWLKREMTQLALSIHSCNLCITRHRNGLSKLSGSWKGGIYCRKTELNCKKEM